MIQQTQDCFSVWISSLNDTYIPLVISFRNLLVIETPTFTLGALSVYQSVTCPKATL